MPKIEIDYSNTIFYKIYCRDPSINDLYIGHTTNFVQRKHAHKQSCLNKKCSNYNCKLYDVIRKNKGWDNWKIEIIAFHECDNLMSAKKYEQKYFEDYKATLNSIEPIPKPKPKISKDIVEKKKPAVLYCDVCNIHLNSVKIQEIHNKTTKHLKNLSCDQQIENMPTTVEKFCCEMCDFKCRKESNWNNHLLTLKHQARTKLNNKMPTNATKNYCEICQYNTSNTKDYRKHLLTSKHQNRAQLTEIEHKNPQKSPDVFQCKCGKSYMARNSLWYHKKVCSIYQGYNNITTPETHTTCITPINDALHNSEIDKEMLIQLLLKNQAVMEKMIEIMPNIGNYFS